MKIFVALKSSVEISVAMRGFSQKVYSEVIEARPHMESHICSTKGIQGTAIIPPCRTSSDIRRNMYVSPFLSLVKCRGMIFFKKKVERYTEVL
jgi:hypothetical protein